MTVATAHSFYVELARDVTVICFTVNGLDEDNYEAVSEELLEFVTLVTANGPAQVVVELSPIRRIDELGVAMLHALHDSIAEAGGTTIFCRLSPVVSSAIREAGLSSVFDIRNTRGDAMWSF